MPASKKARSIRRSDEFLYRQLLSAHRPPAIPATAFTWDLTSIMAARDAQLAGRFRQPSQMASSMRTNDALFMAWRSRIAPAKNLAVAIEATGGAKGKSIAAEAECLFGQSGVGVSANTIADINSDLANHGLAVGYNAWRCRSDGARIDVEHRAWPLELVEWSAASRQLYTRVERAEEPREAQPLFGAIMAPQDYEPIIHGDGRWVVYASHEQMPWQKDAAILSAALVWAAHAFAQRDWARGSSSHGNAKVVGELPEGVALQETDSEGNSSMSDEASAFLALLEDIASLDTPVGIKPAGSKVDYLINGSRAWEVWERLMLNREKAAARIYLGTDGILGAAGGAPGVDISELFGVATTIIQGDIRTIERCFHSGVMEPWCAVNFGDSSMAPRRAYVMPDPDAQRSREEGMENEAALCTAVQARNDCGLPVTQEWLDELTCTLGLSRVMLPVEPTGEPAEEQTVEPQPIRSVA